MEKSLEDKKQRDQQYLFDLLRELSARVEAMPSVPERVGWGRILKFPKFPKRRPVASA